MADVPISAINVTPQQKSYYEESLPAISAVEKYAAPSMPLEDAVAEGNRMVIVVGEDRAKLELSGIDPVYLDSLQARVGAFAWSAAALTTYIDTESTARSEWVAIKPESDKVRKDVFKTMYRAFRKDQDLTGTVDKIKDGQGNSDYVLDFLSIHKVTKANVGLFEAVHGDLTLIERSAELYTKLSNIYSRMVTDPKKLNEAKVICYKAWAYLKEAIDEIYEAGRYVFDEEDPRHFLYYSDYHVRLGDAAAKAMRQKKEEETAAANEPAMVNG